jgi:hypothetical protein
MATSMGDEMAHIDGSSDGRAALAGGEQQHLTPQRRSPFVPLSLSSYCRRWTRPEEVLLGW